LSYHQRVSRLKNITGKLKTYMSKVDLIPFPILKKQKNARIDLEKDRIETP
jgi:hypothetical protein